MDSLRHRMDLAIRFAEGKSESYHARFLKEQLKVLDVISDRERYLSASFYVPGELLALVDVPVVFIERLTGFAAANRMVRNLAVRRIASQMPPCGCSYQLLFESLIREGIIPPPAGFVAAGFPCDDALMYCWSASARYGAPFYMLDIVQDPEEERAITRIAHGLRELYAALASRFGRASTIEEVVEASNDAMRIKCDIDRLRAQYPGILDSMESFRLFTLYNDLGRGPTKEILCRLRSAIEERIPLYRPLESPRLVWLGLLPLYQNSLIRDIENTYGCRIVHEELFDFGKQLLSGEDLYGDLARRIVHGVFFSLDRRVRAIIQHVDCLKADGVIHFSQRNCRFLPPMVPLLRRRLEAMGLPLVEIQGDVIDADGFDRARAREPLDAFFERISRRRS